MSAVYIVQSSIAESPPSWLSQIALEDIERLVENKVSCLLVDMGDAEQAYNALEKIRANSIPAIYLMPVVVVRRSDPLPDEITRSFDAVIDASQLTERDVDELSAGFAPVNEWIDSLDIAKAEPDRYIAQKIIRHFTSRSLAADAVITSHSKSGFIYPELEPFFGVSDSGVLATLEYLELQNMVSGEFQTKARFCGHCHSAFLNFKEVCTHCGSEDLSIDELVHHFKCGYTAELSDFRHGDELICPKCDRGLKHLGVDYDKPSIMYRCNSCAHAFQEPGIMTTCFSCGRSAEPEYQLHKTIKKYTTTSIGRHAARFGLESLFGSILESELQLVPFQNFLQFVRIESARIERYKKSQSTLLLFYLKGLDTVYAHLGMRAKDIFRELSSIIHSVMRTSDVISAKDEAVFAMLLVETSKDNAKRAVDRMTKGVSELLEENLGSSLDLVTELHEVTSENLDPTVLLENFLGKHID